MNGNQSYVDDLTRRNEDIISCVSWLATLDFHTCPSCRIRDLKKYTLHDHQPIGHLIPSSNGPGATHQECRCVVIPVMKSWRELGVPIDDMKPGTRASMGGPVPADWDYGRWIATQNESTITKAMGPERAKLLIAGGIEFGQLYDDLGVYLTLNQLRQRNFLAFALTGLP